MVKYDLPKDAVFKALSDSTRRVMVERLAREPMSVAQLAAPFEISAPAISRHLRVLERAGLLEREIRGTTHICHLRGEGLTQARAWLDEQRRFWERSLDRLENYFANTQRTSHAKRRTEK